MTSSSQLLGEGDPFHRDEREKGPVASGLRGMRFQRPGLRKSSYFQQLRARIAGNAGILQGHNRNRPRLAAGGMKD